MRRTKIMLLAGAVLWAGACGSATGDNSSALTIGESVASDLAALAEETVDAFLVAAPAASACMGELRLEAAPELDDLARYDQSTATVAVRVPATAASLEGSLIHELAHHLEVSCPSHVDFRPVFLAAQGHPPGTPWFGETAWQLKPSEQFAEAVVAATLPTRRRNQLRIQLTPEALEATRNWLQAEA
jgi:hypothetical protein